MDERVTRLERQIEKMDMELKEHFTDQRLFISDALAGVEQHLGDIERRLGARLDKIDRAMKAAFAGVDAKLSTLIERGERPARARPSRRR